MGVCRPTDYHSVFVSSFTTHNEAWQLSRIATIGPLEYQEKMK